MNQTQLRNTIKASSEMAQVVVNYYLELKKCGLGDDKALQMAIGYQHSIIEINIRMGL